MKNNKLIYLATLAVGMLAAGCSDQFLEDKKQYGVYNENTFENEAQTGWFIDKVYYDFYYGYNTPTKSIVGLWEDRTALTEEKSGISDLINPDKTFEKADDCSQYYGIAPATNVTNNPYSRIRNCNFIILNIDAKGKNISDGFKKTAKGQMYFLRAMQYYDLVRMYGGVPIVTTVDNAEAENPAIKYPRSTTTDCVTQIVEDLNMAASLLPDQWGTANYGRFTRAAALAMKSRVLMTYASPLYNKDWDNNDNQRWKDALQAGLEAETALSAAGYGLYGSSAKEWNNMFLIDNAFCKEAIMVKMLDGALSGAENNGWEVGLRMKSQGGDGGFAAPKGMIDLFPMANGKRPTVANGYDEFSFFLNRDPRFYRTFAFSGCKWGYKGKDSEVVWAYRWDKGNKSYNSSDNNNVSSPAFVRKMSNTTVDNTFKYSGTDVMEYRYAELLLNIAECYAATGNINKSVEYIGKVRARVGIPSSDNYGIGTLTTKYQAIEACLYERRVEFAYEGKRALDIQRWMLYNDDAASGNNTCSKLGVAPLNGTHRVGNYLLCKTVSTNDPLSVSRATVSVDPDASTFQADLQKLSQFWVDNFTFQELLIANGDTPWDYDTTSKKQMNIDWKQRYYVWGLHRAPLTSNTWLTQTKGWLDANSQAGTFDYQN